MRQPNKPTLEKPIFLQIKREPNYNELHHNITETSATTMAKTITHLMEDDKRLAETITAAALYHIHKHEELHAWAITKIISNR